MATDRKRVAVWRLESQIVAATAVDRDVARCICLAEPDKVIGRASAVFGNRVLSSRKIVDVIAGTALQRVVSFPAIDQKRQISTAGGMQPRWRRDDRELYYLAPDGAMMAVEFRVDPSVESGTPHALFNTGLNVDMARDQFAVSPNGERFLIQLPEQGGTETPVTVVMNWTAALRK